MNAVVLKQLDAMDAQIELLRVMAAGIRHGLTAPKPRAEAAPLLPDCQGVEEEFCGRRNPDAIRDLGGMGDGPRQRMCRGCGLDPVTGRDGGKEPVTE